jgi:hypothetical protein
MRVVPEIGSPITFLAIIPFSSEEGPVNSLNSTSPPRVGDERVDMVLENRELKGLQSVTNERSKKIQKIQD